MPHKVAVIPYLDEITPEGKDIGAINTVFLRTGSTGRKLVVGTNTDCIGIREAVRQNVSSEKFNSFEGRPGLIVGAGGTARAAVYSMKKWMKCSKIYFVNREETEVDAVMAGCVASGFGDNLIYVADASCAASLEKPGVIVSAIPDFPPKTAAEMEARRCLDIMLSEEKGTLLDMCYHPSSNTEVTRLAKSRRWQVVPGVEAMIWQGVEQARYWTGKESSELPVEQVKEVIARATASGC
ncbi:MAG: hypothetical protein M1818_002412 [Claussenomyces sp. TS43310]|nr:MAG: hypothetical protein M1818_002412 [Claussenomyces sp. TS43310]